MSLQHFHMRHDLFRDAVIHLYDQTIKRFAPSVGHIRIVLYPVHTRHVGIAV